MWLRIFLLSSLFASGVYCQHVNKPVSAVLHSSWPRTPLLLEASEFVAQQEAGALWTFVEQLKDIHSSTTTDKELYDAVLEVAEELLPAPVYNVFIFSLALHTESPAVEMYNQVAVERLSELGEVDCPAFVDVGCDTVACSADELADLLLQDNCTSTPQLYEFDHRYPSSQSVGGVSAVLYAELGTTSFASLHTAVCDLARQGKVEYVLRHYVKDRPDAKTTLSGYGVELAVKSTEYKAVDDTQVQGDESRSVQQTDSTGDIEGFVFSTLKERAPSMEANLEEFKSHLLQGAAELPELKQWQLHDLGLQAAQRASTAGPSFALGVMRDLAQNLPVQAKSLARTQVSKELRQEIKKNQKVLASMGISPGDNIVVLDGMVLQEENTDIFQLLEVVLSELRLLEGVAGLGVNHTHHQSLLAVPVHSEAASFAVDVRNESVVFINDLELDKIYKVWSSSLQQFLQPAFPGMMRQVAKNVFTIVFMIDPVTSEGAEMVDYIKLFLDHMIPTRLGVLLVVREEVGVAISRGFSYLVEHKSAREALRWMHKVHNITSPERLNVSDVVESFESKYMQASWNVPHSVEEIFSEQYDSNSKKAAEFFAAKGLGSLPQVLVNGEQCDLEEDLESAIFSKIQQQTFHLQQAIFTGKLKQKTNVYDYFLNRSNVLQRVNKHVMAKSSYFDLSYRGPSKGLESAGELSDRQLSATVAHSLVYYLSKEGEFLTKQLSIWVVADLATVAGRNTLLSALDFAAGSKMVRVAVVLATPTSCSLARCVQTLLLRLSGQKAWEAIRSALQEGAGLDDCYSDFSDTMDSQEVHDIISAHVMFAQRVLKLKEGENALLCNGRLVGPLDVGEVFTVEDISMLVSLESATHSAALLEVVEGAGLVGMAPDDDTSEYRSEVLMGVASLLRSEPKRRRIAAELDLKDKHSVLQLPPSSLSEVRLHCVAVLDPLTPSTQWLAPLLQALHTAISLDLRIVLNPQTGLSEMPIKRFYRYVIEPELSFESDGSFSPGPVAVFSSLPQSALLTLQLAVPHSWLVAGVWAPHDLDNIRLAEVVGGVSAEFQLQHILVEGQCFDSSSDQPTPGLEYVLGSASEPEKFDTIVMANLGYFQLKAGPGAWTLRLREGRSRQLYSIQNHFGGHSWQDGATESGESKGIHITVRSFRGATLVVKVAKQPGMEGAGLLEEQEVGEEDNKLRERKPQKPQKSTLWDAVTSLLGGGEGEVVEEEGAGPRVSVNETINIFSIASGHLYERFLRIMMLSVLKHTSNPVKFWFLKNFLSPTFKDFIPYMASEYGFAFELVEYKWPRWLHAQSEKQRVIWGYKILFLDVLFPLDVKKIIFVDADQIVRTDLRELLEVPMEDAPYAYTPFCDSRPEMEGFRFWDRGYWRNHLGTRRYHISALYMVDLLRFRLLAAGDRLRGQYQALSQDPSSLANLDQDLPNNMIHSVPIKSLPQEWLWCETWCSLESKEHAKTIDLCNNPLTKEPKLKSAVRIVPEWTSYDTEIKTLWDKAHSSTEEGNATPDEEATLDEKQKQSSDDTNLHDAHHTEL